MKPTLLIGAVPAILAAGTLAALAQDPMPPAPAPADRSVTTPQSDAPAATEAPATPATPTVEAPASSDTSSRSAATTPSPATFATEQAATEMRSTKIVGLDVYNARNEKIGDINDLIFGNDGKLASAVIGVGGFLGMGEKLVAVPFSELTFSRDGDGNLRVTIASTKEALENAPDFKYYELPRT